MNYVLTFAAGTLRHAQLKPDLPAYLFPKPVQKADVPKKAPSESSSGTIRNDFEFGELNDEDLVGLCESAVRPQPARSKASAAAAEHFHDIDNLAGASVEDEGGPRRGRHSEATSSAAWHPQKMQNGNWACNHKCKDKQRCVHGFSCREREGC